MRRLVLAATLIVTLIAASVALLGGPDTGRAGTATPPLREAAAPPPGPRAETAGGKINVRFRPGASSAQIDRAVATHGLRPLKVQARAGIYQLAVPAGADVGQVLAAYRRDPLVAEANYSYIVRATDVPNDTNYSYEWDMQNTVGGMWAQAAWDVAPNHGQGVVVAVIDTGVAYEDAVGPGPINPQTTYKKAPDLATKTFVAPWDFANNDSHANDDNGHGTHVTGTIAEDTNNNYGVVGVAYNATIMPIKVLAFDGTGNDADLVAAIYYAVDHGAHVINMSLGFTGTGTPDANGVFCTEVVGLNAALDYAYSHNVTVVAAAGNDGATITCPAAYPTVISVGATRFDGQVTSYSNFGSRLDVAAPGGDPNVDQNNDGFSDGVPQETYCYDSFTLLLLQSYDTFCDIFESGTSMATPHVTGTAALLLGEDPSLTPDQVRAYIETTARDRGAAGWDPYYGWGEIDAFAAVSKLKGLATPTATPTTLATSTPTPTPTQSAVSTPTATNTAVPTSTPASGPRLHIGNLDAAVVLRRSSWSGRVTAYVYSGNGALVRGAVVTGNWTGGAAGTSSCVTNKSGRCSLTSPSMSLSLHSVTFTVTNVALAGYTYDPAANQDPGGDSNGTTITVSR